MSNWREREAAERLDEWCTEMGFEICDVCFTVVYGPAAEDHAAIHRYQAAVDAESPVGQETP